MFKTMFFFCVQLCLDPWTVLRQADIQRYLFWGGKGMFLVFMFLCEKNCLWTPSQPSVTVGYSYRLSLLLILAKIRISLTCHLQVMSLSMSLEDRPQ
jgi:hypothetical protein